MQIQTNAKCRDCVSAIKKAVERKFPGAELEMELSTTDKILHIHGLPEDSEHAAQVESAIKESGFEGAWIQR
ncbi:MAG: heavy-metal-associated domain-containing protein [Muribaculaceae bacterium]|nr:heavy-metal-associated domain-containing protein [Muribaculaceae bacterium]